MKKTRLWLSALALAVMLGVAQSASAGVWVGIRFGPPPPRREIVVARPGWVWAHGHWGRHHARYVWVPGRWIAHRPGHEWVDGRWYHRHDGWAYREGRWHRR